MTYDLLIRNGTIVDGTGADRRRADLAVVGGKIVGIGEVAGDAKQVIDAADLIVAPGFVDPHTHYDAQICWEQLITPSSWHGVTTVVLGNCGVGIAPCKPEAREIATWDLVNVEGIPYEVLKEGITWDWETFPEYMDAAANRGSAINLGFLAPLTPFRHFVMGEESLERAATPTETRQIAALIKEAIQAGALGFSSSAASTHIGYKGRPLASRLASLDELKAYAGVLKELGRGAIEIMLTKDLGILDDEELNVLDALLNESGGRPITWGSLLKRYDLPDAYKETLRKAIPYIERGALPQVLNFPVEADLNLRAPFNLGPFPSWAAAFNQPQDVQERVYRDESFRSKFREEMNSELGPKFLSDWKQLYVKSAGRPEVKALEGQTVAQVARERGADAVDTFLDLALEDNLDLTYGLYLCDVAEDLIPDPRTLIGLGDGGAHLTMICDAGYCTQLLGSSVRDQGLMSLEAGVQRITSQPADFFGITKRGRLQEGCAADIVVFDYDTIGSSTSKVFSLHDLPGGSRRLVTEPQGIKYTLVNGSIVNEGGKSTNALAGEVLRSGAC